MLTIASTSTNQSLLVGRYEFSKLLGHGTYGKVYLAHDINTGDHVAIKVIDNERFFNSDLFDLINRQVSILRRLHHPNIVQLFEVMATEDNIYIVMEYCRGGQLFNEDGKCKLKEEVARKYFQQLISAVSSCHAREVFHRDLKPENLLLDENGNLKVSDFGLSVVSDQIHQDGHFHTFCGSPAYMAPEVLMKKEYDAGKADIWSCGVVLFVLTVGRLPFNDENISIMCKKICEGEFQCPRWTFPDLSSLLINVLDTNPETRITIPEIMENHWFKKEFNHINFHVEDDKIFSINDDSVDNIDPASCSNQSFSESGFDLSGLRSPNDALMSTIPTYQSLLLDRYEIGKLLGHGSFAKVYHARNVRTGQSVAIKVIDKETVFNSGLISNIEREVSILRGLRHPNIVKIFEVLATKAKIYFVMEYVRGGELFSQDSSRGRLNEEVARKYFQELISAVSFCHARGVFHRDLKPQNLLLDENGNLKVSDFGLSAVSDQIRQDGLFHTFCGTPAYVAPEVLSKKGYDAAKVDIWSCGVVLFVLMAGHLPFYGQNIMLMYKKIHKAEFRCPHWFSHELRRLLIKVLDPNPGTRITIPQIMKNPWFIKGFKNINLNTEYDEVFSFDDDDAVTSLPRPSLNAFDIISLSSGLDLSGLFEERVESSWFVSGVPVSKILWKMKEIAKFVYCTVKKNDCVMSLEGSRGGVKGPLTIAAEILEVNSELVVVRIKNQGGNISEYELFCHKKLKPELQKLMQQQKSDFV